MSDAEPWIFWDNDGVLVDTEQLYFQANREILTGLGIEFTEEMFVELLLRQARGVWHLLEANGCSESEIETLRSKRNDCYAELLAGKNHTLPGVDDVLAELHGKFRMAIVTSSRKDHFDLIHQNTEILPYMEFVLSQPDYENSKPAPDPYLKAIECAAAEPKACLVIEDSERGLASATEAGLRCWVVKSPFASDADFSLAERVLDSVQEIPALLIA